MDEDELLENPIENSAEEDAKGKGGRPHLTPEQIAEKKKEILQKIEPYLKTGLSVNKAIREAQVHNSEFYKYMNEDELFREKINQYRQYIAILLNSSLVSHLREIVNRQAEKKPLHKEDIAFLQWFALNSNLTKGEFGERKDVNLFDPEAEIQKVKGILEEETTKEIDHGD